MEKNYLQDIETMTRVPGLNIDMAMIKVTPAIAKEFLKKNSGVQRRVKMGAVERMASDIIHNRWKADTGEAIRFNRAGIMIDGQHRCLAIIKSGIALPILCMFNCEDEIMTVIDTGTKRSAADTLKVHSFKNPTGLAATISLYLRYKHTRGHLNISRRPPSTPEILEFAQKNPDVEYAVSKLYNSKLPAGIPRSAFCVCFYITSKYDAATAEEAYASMANPAAKIVRSNAMVLYRDLFLRLKAASKGDIDQNYQLAITIKAFNAFWRGENISKLAQAAGYRFPQLLCEIEYGES